MNIVKTIAKKDANLHKTRKRTLLAVALTIVTLAFAGFFYLYLSNSYQEHELPYTQTANTTYKVCLHDNQHYEDDCQASDLQYVSTLIKNIPVDIEYKLTAKLPFSIRYSYSVYAKTIITQADDKANTTLYEKSELLVVPKTENAKGAHLDIEDKVDIDYAKFNSIARAFKDDYSLSKISARLEIIVKFDLRATNDNFPSPIIFSRESTLTVGLLDPIVSISPSSVAIDDSGTLKNTTATDLKDSPSIIIGVISALTFVIAITCFVFNYFYARYNRSRYEKERSKILRTHNQIIVSVTKLPKIPRNKIIKVTDFEELVDVRETVQKPIVHYEIPAHQSIFILKDGDTFYAYILT